MYSERLLNCTKIFNVRSGKFILEGSKPCSHSGVPVAVQDNQNGKRSKSS